MWGPILVTVAVVTVAVVVAFAAVALAWWAAGKLLRPFRPAVVVDVPFRAPDPRPLPRRRPVETPAGFDPADVAELTERFAAVTSEFDPRS